MGKYLECDTPSGFRLLRSIDIVEIQSHCDCAEILERYRRRLLQTNRNHRGCPASSPIPWVHHTPDSDFPSDLPGIAPYLEVPVEGKRPETQFNSVKPYTAAEDGRVTCFDNLWNTWKRRISEVYHHYSPLLITICFDKSNSQTFYSKFVPFLWIKMCIPAVEKITIFCVSWLFLDKMLHKSFLTISKIRFSVALFARSSATDQIPQWRSKTPWFILRSCEKPHPKSNDFVGPKWLNGTNKF